MKQVRLQGGYRLLQEQGGLGLTQDSVLLADFLDLRPGERAIELGCGQGGLWVLALLKNPGAALDGLELDPQSLELARQNARRCGLSHRGELFLGDAAAFAPPGPRYDVCLANPPYGLPGPPSPDPRRRLARSGCPEAFFQGAGRLLGQKGRFYFCWPARHFFQGAALLEQAGFSPRRVRLVYPRPDKAAQLALVMARRGRGETQFDPPLVLRDAGGEYTQEYRRIYGVSEEEWK